MSDAIEVARASLAEVERRISEADEACAAAEAEFKAAPSARSHSSCAVATQLAANAHTALEPARAAVAAAERADQTEKLTAALARAQRDLLLAATEPAMARLRAMHAEAVDLVASIDAACSEQARACREADALARSLSIVAPVPRPVRLTFLRAIVGIWIARDTYSSGARWAPGVEPFTFIVPRPALPSGHAAADEWVAAKRVALPASEFLPGAHYDLGHPSREFFHTPLR